ncbi:hypothetical protein Tco_0906752 [Tanacetum coccineum]|uniref:Uncharacterized protein n=1 Tax=Tanacetum coccineum TaxID=301880 RepID=A0ABQ5CK48_9ASTR
MRLLSYKERNEFFCFEYDSKEDSVGKTFVSTILQRLIEFKGVPHPLSGDYTPTPQEEIDESLYVYGKKGHQEPEPNVSDDRSSEYSTCQSNDSAGSIGTSSELSVDPESEISSVTPEVYVSTPITSSEKDQATPKVNRKNWNVMMERELGEGYSFTKKKCFVCGSLSHLIKDCDYYEKKMAREVEVKKQRGFNTGNRVAKPVWTNTNRVNHANKLVPRSVQLNAGRPNINSIRPNINTGRTNINLVRPRVNTGSSNVNTVRSRQLVPYKTLNSFSPKRPQDHPLKNMVDRGIFDSGCSGHMTGNKDQLEDFEEFNGGSVTFEVRYLSVLGKRKPKKISEALQDDSWVQAMQEELLQFKLQQVWVLVDLPHGIIDSDQMKVVYVSQTLMVCDLYHPKKVYKWSKLCMIESSSLSVYATISTSPRASMDTRGVRLTRLYLLKGVKKDIMLVQVYVDDIIFGSTKKSWCDEFEALMKSIFPISSMGEIHDRLSHVFNCYRPDLMYRLSLLFSLSGHSKIHISCCKEKSLKYLKGQTSFGLWKSTTGGCQFLGQRLILWHCKKQTILATSTTEAEYVAAANCCGQVLWVQNQLLDYGFNFMNTKIHIDNESTICIVKNPVYHSKTKHIEIRHHFIRDCYEKKLISVDKIHRDLNVADLLTKPFDGPRVNYLVSIVLLPASTTSLVPKPSNFSVQVTTFYYYFRFMAQLKYCDKHNQVGFLRKPDESAGFAEIVDFLRGSNLRYALTTNPTIYDSLVKQFWQTATANTLADGTLEIQTTIDTIVYTITEASIRNKLQLADASVITMLPNNKIFEGMRHMGYPTDGTKLHHPTPTPIPASTPTPIPVLTAVNLLAHFFPHLMIRIDSLEKDHKQTKLTMGSAIVKLVKKVKKLEGILKRRNVVLSDSKEEEPEDQGRKSQDDPLVSLVQGLVTPSKTTVNTSGEEQVEDISPTTLEAAKTLSPRSGAEGVNTVEGVNTGSIKVSTISGQVSTDSINKTIPSPDKGQREGKAPMIIEEAPKKTKEQILQEEASLAEAIRLDNLEKEEEAKQVHLDSLLAQRIAEEELNEQQRKEEFKFNLKLRH